MPAPRSFPRDEALQLGARDLPVPPSGLRPESFAWLRAGGVPHPKLPVMIVFWPDGTRHFVDGRHRISLAREAGESTFRGVLLGYGPRGGLAWRYSGSFPI